MHFLSSKLKKFDIHTKTIDGVHDQQTVTGAVITVISAVIVFLLVMTQFNEYQQVDIVSRMVADSTVGVEDVEIIFDIEFYKTSCDRIHFSQEVTRGTMHSHEPLHMTKEALEGRSCWLHGAIVTDKVGGSFKFMIDPVSDNDNVHSNDITHKINTLAFHSADGAPEDLDLPEMAHPLSGQESEVDSNVRLYQYGIQVVPTKHTGLNAKDSYHVNQYAVIERQIGAEQLKHGVLLNGQTYRNVMGIVFTYDFYPVMLVHEEKSLSTFSFFSNLCAIVGGVITLLGLIEQCIHQSTKSLMGKKD